VRLTPMFVTGLICNVVVALIVGASRRFGSLVRFLSFSLSHINLFIYYSFFFHPTSHGHSPPPSRSSSLRSSSSRRHTGRSGFRRRCAAWSGRTSCLRPGRCSSRARWGPGSRVWWGHVSDYDAGGCPALLSIVCGCICICILPAFTFCMKNDT